MFVLTGVVVDRQPPSHVDLAALRTGTETVTDLSTPGGYLAFGTPTITDP